VFFTLSSRKVKGVFINHLNFKIMENKIYKHGEYEIARSTLIRLEKVAKILKKSFLHVLDRILYDSNPHSNHLEASIKILMQFDN
jgi:hypothetical protein